MEEVGVSFAYVKFKMPVRIQGGMQFTKKWLPND